MVQEMGESRQDLLLWINELLGLGYTKVEQCGSGAAHCQIMDSIYRDVPLSKVKFAAKHEYEYIQNYKVLQAVFDKHKIDNFIPVERLSKCKFLQWLKKYWDQYYPGGTYDASARRNGAGGARKAGVNSPIRKSSSTNVSNSSLSGNGVPARSAAPAARVAKSVPVQNSQKVLVDQLSAQNAELKVTIEQVEKEREFYFGKLREIELYVQTSLDSPETASLTTVLQEIQAIMYRTEDGFEVPAEEI